MGFMDQAKDLYKMQKQAKQIKKELKNIHVEAEVDGVVVMVSGEQEVLDIKIPEALMDNAERVGNAVKEAINKAIKKSQEVAAEKMKEAMGGLQGLFGGGGGEQ